MSILKRTKTAASFPLNPRPHGVLFDLDGTLLDTAPDLIAACNATLTHFGFKAADPELIRTKVTSGMRAMMRPGIPEAEHDLKLASLIEGEMRDFFAEYYTSHICVYTKPFAGMPELIEKLHQAGIKCAVVTNKYCSMALELLGGFAFNQDLDLLLGGDSCAHGKPHPEPLLTACRQLGLKPADTLYIGDHLNDIEAARHAGCISCTALWGYGAVECGDPFAWQSDYYVDTPADLTQLILG